MDYKWTYKTLKDKRLKEELAMVLGIKEDLSALLVNRGIKSFEQAKKYFRPDIDMLHDPFLMRDMDAAVDHLSKALENDESILIYGDYDVDGTTSVSMVYSFLNQLSENIAFYIPDRYKEGYGLSYQGIDFAEENGISLIICLDCGVKAIDKVEYAKQKGIDIIICDHHRPGKQLPDAIAVLDPKREDCTYPYKELCGCGVGFKLLQAFSIKKGIDRRMLFQYIDLLAIAIGSDIVPITGENRVLAHFGLKKVNENPMPGIRALLEVAKAPELLTITDLVFIIGPRINAAGRIKSGQRAVELLISENADEQIELSKKIDQYNTHRKELDKSITEEALEIINSDSELIQQKSSVVFKDGWHKGVVGIVASRLIEHYYRPTIVLTQSNGKATGSARSVSHFDVYNAIEKCSDLLENFGGHKYAAGLTLDIENVEAFQKKFEEVVSIEIDPELLIPEISIDEVIDFDRISDSFIKIIDQMAPFGPGNMKPIFVTHHCKDTGWTKPLDGGHIKLYIHQEQNPALKIGGIAFKLGDKLDIIQSGKPFSIAFQVYENEWNGKKKIELMVKDIKYTSEVITEL